MPPVVKQANPQTQSPYSHFEVKVPKSNVTYSGYFYNKLLDLDTAKLATPNDLKDIISIIKTNLQKDKAKTLWSYQPPNTSNVAIFLGGRIIFELRAPTKEALNQIYPDIKPSPAANPFITPAELPKPVFTPVKIPTVFTPVPATSVSPESKPGLLASKPLAGQYVPRIRIEFKPAKTTAPEETKR